MFQIKYKETYMKNKEKALGVNVSDSRTLHSLHVAKMCSDVSKSLINQYTSIKLCYTVFFCYKHPAQIRIVDAYS